MKKGVSKLLPKHERLLANLGENLRLARLRRKLSAEQVAERAGLSRSTLHLMENGSAGTSLGKLVQVLAVLGQEGDLSQVAADDALGRKLEDARLTETRRRAPKKKTRK
ncbi:MAG: transcriptional regulator with XRE-family HTH domain [Verrucomicrobiales bacterium]|jgi:transcriptional regulator with XRE-family HTH domain